MKRITVVICTVLSGAFLLEAADEQRLNVIDYFVRLPPNMFEAPARAWLPNCTVIDKQNGYMRCTGDGAQPNFEIALFRYRDPARAGLLAICSGELEGADSLILNFFQLGADGKMHKTPRSVFPVGDSVISAVDGGLEYKNWRFELPRHGKTILVRDQRSGEILHKVTWNGEKFQEEK